MLMIDFVLARDIKVKIYPADSKIFLAYDEMDVTCTTEPVEIITNNLISNIKFQFVNSTYRYASDLRYLIDGHSQGKICFICGHLLLVNATRCYDRYG